MGISAIYIITSRSGKEYVGSAHNYVKRWNDHRYELRKGTHCNRKLQNAWNKYGTLEFELLEIVPDVSQLLEREQYWIDRLNTFRDGYNMTPDARSGHGRKHTQATKDLLSGYALLRRDEISAIHKGKVISEEHKEALRAANLGRKHSEETKAKMRAAALARKK